MMKQGWRISAALWALAALSVFWLPDRTFALSYDTKAKEIFLVEASTGTVLLSKGADDLVPSASLAKLMTVEFVLHNLQAGKLTSDTEFPVSEYAWRTGGALSRTSTMFAALKSKIRVDDLLKGITVQYANDACIILAEGMAGSEDAFAGQLTARAREIGLEKSVFANSNGLPDLKNVTTMREMVMLARKIHDSYPDHYPYFSIPDFEWNKIDQRNRTPLLGKLEGLDGMSAGFTEGVGYSIVASAERNGVRLYLAMNGLASLKEREDETRDILEWAFTAFAKRQIFGAGEPIGEVAVYGGTERHLTVAADGPVAIFEEKRDPERISAKITYEWPLKAPVEKGSKVGYLRLYKGSDELQAVPVYATSPVPEGTLTERALDAVLELLLFWA